MFYFIGCHCIFICNVTKKATVKIHICLLPSKNIVMVHLDSAK
nr:MAG TPA: hypothetical protein [Caudoviricetes sp.]